MARTPTRELAAALLADGRELTVRLAELADVTALLGIQGEASKARECTAYLAEADGAPVCAAVLVKETDSQRVAHFCVVETARGLGVASFVVEVIGEHRAHLGEPELIAFASESTEAKSKWRRLGFEGDGEVLRRVLPIAAKALDADAMRELGRRLAGVLRAGDVVIASGELGAGKTTFAQGLGIGLDVDGPVISPTFVLSRIHPPRGCGPALVHVDAYRLGSAAELEDLDLDASLADSVTLVEWGGGVAEGLAADRLDLSIRRGVDPGDELRWVFLTPIGRRWDRAQLVAALAWDTADAPESKEDA